MLTLEEDKQKDYVAEIQTLVSEGKYTEAREKLKTVPNQVEVRRAVGINTGIYL